MATLWGFFPGQGERDAFQNWTGESAAAVVNFVDVFADNIDKGLYLENEIGGIWNSGSVPMLTLEPFAGGSVCQDTSNGDHDSTWNAWANAIQNYLVESGDRKLFIRLAHEMNGDWYPWAQNPSAYVDMWRHVEDIIYGKNGVNHDNAKLVWCPNGTDVPSGNDAEDYYPGDSHVDWVGIDEYNRGSTGGGWRSPSAVFDGMLSRTNSLTDKPVCIPETASTSKQGGSVDNGAKAQWIHDAADYFSNTRVKLWCWFNQDKETDWPTFAGPRGTSTADIGGTEYNVYESYANEIATDAQIGASGDQVLTANQFSGSDITDSDDSSAGGGGDDGDLGSATKIGEYGLGTPGGPVTVPVVERGDVANEMWETQTESGPGVIPLVDPGQADIPQIEIKTQSSGVLSPTSTLSTGGGGSNDSSAAGGDGTGIGNPSFAENITWKYAVADLGLDNTGGTAITESDLDGALADGVGIRFEPGTYRYDPVNDGKGMIFSDYNNVAFVGDGDHREDVVFKHTDNSTGRLWNFANGCDNVWWANFVVDHGDASVENFSELYWTADSGHLYAYNFGHIGRATNELDAPGPGDPASSLAALTFGMGSGASAWIENYQNIGKPGRVVDYPHGCIGIFAGYGNKGDIDLVNAHIAYKGEHACYASRTPANVRVEGGYFHNNINTNMRICGEGSFLRNATVHLDPPDGFEIESDTGEPKAMRGVRWEDGSDPGSEGQTGGYIRNVDFIKSRDIDAASHLIQVDGNAGSMSIETCRFRDESRDYSNVIHIQDIGDGPQGQTPPQPWPVSISFCAFTGGGDSAAVHTERPDTELAECCLGMSGGPGFDVRGDGSIDESETSTGGCDRAKI